MGRLSKAQERIKSRKAAIASVNQPTGNVRKYTTQPADDPLARELTRVTLDQNFLLRHHIITDEIDPVVRTAYKMLRTRTLHRMRANAWRSLAVTSATQGDGKSISAINLAISLAGDVNHSVCLVDLDLRHSSVAEYLGIPAKYGISDCLQNDVPLEVALISPDIDRLVVLPNIRTVTHSSELISSPAMHELSDMLASDPKRIVIYDMPPLLSADDMLAFEPLADAILFVVAEGLTRRTDTMKACELLEDSNVIGTVLNRSDEKTAAYY